MKTAKRIITLLNAIQRCKKNLLASGKTIRMTNRKERAYRVFKDGKVIHTYPDVYIMIDALGVLADYEILEKTR